MIPWVQFVFPTLGDLYDELDDGQLSDKMFLAVKKFQNKLRQDDNTRTTTGDLVTLTAATGKDMYIATAKINIRGTGASPSVTVQLLVNAVVIEECQWSSIDNVGWNDYEFASVGFNVAAGEIIKLEVTAINNADVEGQLICFEENTGTTPRLAPQAISSAEIDAIASGIQVPYHDGISPIAITSGGVAVGMKDADIAKILLHEALILEGQVRSMHEDDDVTSYKKHYGK